MGSGDLSYPAHCQKRDELCRNYRKQVTEKPLGVRQRECHIHIDELLPVQIPEAFKQYQKHHHDTAQHSGIE